MKKERKRVVLFTTAIRSEYDLQYSVMRAVEAHPALQTQVVVTGAHLSEAYGYTVKEVERDKFSIVAQILSLVNADDLSGRVKSAAIQLVGLIDVFRSQKPDFVVAATDREEALMVATAGSYMGIPVVHIGGGDIATDRNIDNAVRHATTKLAHLHMVTTPLSAQRVIRMGEEPWRVHTVGAPGIDRLLSTPTIAPDALWKYLGFNPGNRPYVVVIQHAISTQVDAAGEQMRTTLEALVQLGLPVFVAYPNSDAGSQQIIAVIREYAGRYDSLFHTYQTLPREIFVNLMRNASALVGNSSCGIIEAPALKLPVINVGDRQRGRECAENVQFVSHDVPHIKSAVERAIFDQKYRRELETCTNPYGAGDAGERIARILAEVEINERLIWKVNTY